MLASGTNEGASLRRQAMWVVGCRIVGIIATVASNIFVARLLGPAEFGAYLLVTTIAAVGSLLAMAGLSEAALRFISHSLGLNQPGLASAYVRRAIRTAAITSLITAAVVTIGFAGLQWATQHALGSVPLLALVAVGIVVLACQQLGAELLRAFGNLKLASFFSGGQTGGPISNVLFLTALAVASFAAVNINATLAVALAVASVCLTCPFVCLAVSNICRGSAVANDSRLTRQQGHELLAVGGVLLLNQILAFGSQHLDVLLAGGLLSSVDLGLYGAAKRSLLIVAMPVQMATLTIMPVIPRLYAQSRLVELQRVVRGAATAAAVPSLVALGLLTLFPGPILGFVLRDSYTGASSLIVVMAAGYLALILSGNPQQVLTMTGRHRAVLAVNFACILVMVAVGLVGARLYGAAGLAAGSAASLIVQNGVLWWLARKELGISTHLGIDLKASMSSQIIERQPPAPRSCLSSEMIQASEPVASSSV